MDVFIRLQRNGGGGMLILNSGSINKPIVHCSQTEYEILIKNNCSPISVDENGWIFLANEKINNILKVCRGGEYNVQNDVV